MHTAQHPPSDPSPASHPSPLLPDDGHLLSAPVSLSAVAREGALLAGAGAAILLQVAHRPVAAGVAEHSDFVHDPVRRLVHTLQYIYAVSLPEAEPVRERVIGWVGRAHAPVRGVDSGGQSYSAEEPDAQLWVAATLYWAAEQVRWRLWGVLDPAAAEQLYREFAVLGTALGMPSEQWPASREDFQRWFEERVGQVEVTEEARTITRDLFAAEHAPLWIRALMPTARVVTAGMLPPRVRSQLGLEVDGVASVREQRLWSVLRSVYPRLPRVVRHAPARWILHGLGVRRGGG